MIQTANLKCEYNEKPMGIDVSHPRLSWEIAAEGSNIMQTAYRVQVSLNENDFSCPLWDSGEVKSDRSVHVKYEGPNLKSDTFYYWRVKIVTNAGESGWSETASWHMGLLSKNDWFAKWIEPKTSTDGCPMLRKTFKISGAVESASVFVSGVGLYELRLNGEKVGQDYLTPGWTSYHKRTQYQIYDITDMVAENNAVGITLADGWFKGHMTWHNKNNMYGDKYACIVQIHIKYKNKKTDIIVSDDTWKSALSEILKSDIYHGETVDLNKVKTGWDEYSYDDSGWDDVDYSDFAPQKLIAQENTSVKIMEEIGPVAVFKTPKGETVIDMGQNMVGFIKLKIKANKGSRIKLKHFEVLSDDGNVFLENLVHAKQTDEYILCSEEEVVLQPRFTFHGFRYVYLEEFPCDPEISQFKGMVIYSEMETTGYFETSNKLINKLQQNILWSQKGNFVDIPSDCPQRSERLGWTGDAQIFIKTAAFNMNCASFFAKWMGDVAADQKEDGMVPWVVPDVVQKEMYPAEWLDGTGQEIPSSAGWGDVAVIVPWELYLCYEDTRILDRQYPSMKAWVDYIRSQGDNQYLWNTGFHFGDWLAADTYKENVFGATSRDFVATAYYAYSTLLLSRIARILDNEEDANEYSKLYEHIIKEFRNEFVTKTGRLSEGTQSAHVLALCFDLVKKEDRQRTADRLEYLIKQNKYKLNTGFLGTPYLCYALSQNGKEDIALKVLLQQECPSWLYQITKGATTIWEYWDNDVRKASYNHYAFGAVGEWMYSVLAGLNIDEENPGYKHSVISPLFAKEFDYVKAGIDTMYGRLMCEWKRKGEQLTIDITVPHNTTTTVRLKDKASKDVKLDGEIIARGLIDETENGLEINLGSGHYILSINN